MIVLFLGIFNTPDLMTYETEHVSKPEEEPIDLANKSSEDVDVIDIDSQNDNQNANYEYYYVYYDEDGNVVDKSPPKAVTSSSTTTSTNKAQEIPLVSTSVNSLLDSEETGDTPTIYAGLSKNSTDTSLGEIFLQHFYTQSNFYIFQSVLITTKKVPNWLDNTCLLTI